MNQHRRAASTSSSSDFYRCYPAENLEITSTLQRGTFESLEFNVGMGFDRSNVTAVESLCNTTTDSSIFFWSDAVIAKVRAAKFRGASLQDKQLRMISYLLELVYDLMIAPDDNVSEKPGFETPLGAWH